MARTPSVSFASSSNKDRLSDSLNYSSNLRHSGIIDLDDVGSHISSFADFSILHVNIRGWRSHSDELSAYLTCSIQSLNLLLLMSPSWTRVLLLPCLDTLWLAEKTGIAQISILTLIIFSLGVVSCYSFLQNWMVQLSKYLNLTPLSVYGSYFIVISARYCCVFGIGLLLEETSARYPLYLTNFRNFAMMSLGLSSWAIWIAIIHAGCIILLESQ